MFIELFLLLETQQIINLIIQLHMKNEHLARYKNPVLIKDQEGKVRQTTYDLPEQSHTYGKKVMDDPEPIKTVVNSWKNAQEAADIPSKRKDFKELNKASVIRGMHTAKDQTSFRKTNDIMVQTKKGQKVVPILLPEEEFSYGLANRPSTPVKLVIGNCYALEQQNKNATMYKMQASQQPKNKTVAHKTKSQLLREEKVKKQKEFRGKPVQQDTFKLSKFTNKNETRINTNLSAFQAVAKSMLASQNEEQNNS